MRLVGVIVALCAAGARASACEPPLTQLRDALPADGATGVPINTQVRLDYFGDATSVGNVEVRTATGSAVPASLEMLKNAGYPLRHLVVLRPNAMFDPDTQYEIVAQGSVVGSFRTGTTADVTRPTFAGLDRIWTNVIDCPSSACCGPNRVAYAALSWSATPSDDGAPSNLRLNVYAPATALPILFALWCRKSKKARVR